MLAGLMHAADHRLAHLAVPGDSDVVLAQTPPVNSAGVDSPRVSLLVSDPDDSQASAYVMPILIGLSYSAAAERTGAAGLKLLATSETPAPPPASAPSPTATPSPVVGSYRALSTIASCARTAGTGA